MMRVVTWIVVILFSALITLPPANAQTTAIAYQGQLQSLSAPANGNFDFEFLLYDSVIGGAQAGPTVTLNGVNVINGSFSVSLDFGSSFPGANRFVEIHVRQAGGGAFTPLSPRQPVTSSPYSIKSFVADTALNATNAVNAVNFSGGLAGDVTGGQSSTTVGRLQGRNVANTPPVNGQVLKFNSATNQWVPDTDNTGTGGSAGTITGVTPGTGLTGGGTTGSVSLGIANGGVGTPQIADGSVTDAKITGVSGSKVTGTVANATSAVTAALSTNFAGPLAGDVTGTQSATTVSRLQTRNVANTAPTNGQVLKFNTATNQWEPNTDNTSSGGGGTITGVTTGTGLTGGGTTGGVTVGIAAGGVGTTQLADNNVTDAKIVSVSGSKVTGAVATATNATQLGGVAANQYLTNASLGTAYIQNTPSSQQTGNFNLSGDGILGGTFTSAGITSNSFGTAVSGTSTSGSGVLGSSPTFRGVFGSSSSGFGVVGSSSTGTGVLASGKIGLNSSGTSWFQGDTTPLTGAGKGVAVGYFNSDAGYVFAYDYSAGIAKNLYINSLGGNVSIGAPSPTAKLDVRSGTSGTAVYGETAVAHTTVSPGVFGKSTGDGGVGVIGEANVGNAWGVAGKSTSSTGVGVYAENLGGGNAILANGNITSTGSISASGNFVATLGISNNGNATQARDKGGFVKAMVSVNSGGVVSRCYNGVTGASTTATCGIIVTSHPNNSWYIISFPFVISDRYPVVTPTGTAITTATMGFDSSSSIMVQIFYLAGNHVGEQTNDSFTLVVF